MHIILKIISYGFYIISGPRFASEIYNYTWDDKKDLPIKEYDDVLDALRYALLTHIETFENKTVEEELEAIQQLGI